MANLVRYHFMGCITITQKIALGVYHPMNKKFYAVYHPEHGQNPLYISVFIDCHFLACVIYNRKSRWECITLRHKNMKRVYHPMYHMMYHDTPVVHGVNHVSYSVSYVSWSESP